MSRTLTILTPVTTGRVGALRAALRALPQGDASPFARVWGTHVARFTLVEALEDRELRPEPDAGAYLVLSTDVDGDPETHVERLRGGLGEWADGIWGHCDRYPGSARARPFRDWLLAHRVPVGFSVAPYRRATVEDVREALAMRRRFVKLACAASSLDAPDLKRAWLRDFGDGRGAT